MTTAHGVAGETPPPHPQPLTYVLRGRGRPRTGIKVEVRIPADELARVDADAAELGITRAAMIREIIEQYGRDAR